MHGPGITHRCLHMVKLVLGNLGLLLAMGQIKVVFLFTTPLSLEITLREMYAKKLEIYEIQTEKNNN